MPEIYNILIVEDDIGEQKLLKMIFNNSGLRIDYKFLNNGEEVINYLSSINVKEKYNLILLDLNLPKVNGIEVIKFIKENSYLKYVPIVVLTTSNNKKDIESAYSLGVGGYLRKPPTIDEYEEAVIHILHYWLKVCSTV